MDRLRASLDKNLKSLEAEDKLLSKRVAAFHAKYSMIQLDFSKLLRRQTILKAELTKLELFGDGRTDPGHVSFEWPTAEFLK